MDEREKTELTPETPAETTPEIPAEATPEIPAEATPETPAEATPETPAETTPAADEAAAAAEPTEAVEETATPAETDKEKKQPRPLGKCWWFYAVLSGIVLLCAVIWCFVICTPGPGGLYARSSTQLDLRSEAVTADSYKKLQQNLPECDIRWNIPIGDKVFDSHAASIRLGTLSENDIENIALFKNLSTVDGTVCTDYDALIALYKAYPELKVRWAVTFGTTKYSQGTQMLRLNMDNCTADELMEKLGRLPDLTGVYIAGAMDFSDQMALAEKYPDVTFDWEVSLPGGLSARPAATEVSFAGIALTASDLDAVLERLPLLPNLQVIDMTDCGLNNDTLVAFREKTGLEISWNIELLGKTFSTTAEEIDLSRVRITDVSEVENALPWFSRLKKVIMCDCGISDEEMDALNKRHEDVQFVWMLRHFGYELRTDTDNFIAAREMDHWALSDPQTSWMTYMEDLIALDLGHMYFSDLSFLYSMPKMQYLIIADCARVTDLTPIGTLEDLIYAELFLTFASDLTPLTNCKKLLDLNICFLPIEYDHLVWFLDQMPQLERLWFAGNQFSKAQRAELEQNYPNIEFYLVSSGHSSGGTWRQHPRYFEMRDVFHMYYMTGGTGGAPV